MICRAFLASVLSFLRLSHSQKWLQIFHRALNLLHESMKPEIPYIYHASESDFVHLCVFEKQIPLPTRLHQVRNDKCFRSIFCKFCFGTSNNFPNICVIILNASSIDIIYFKEFTFKVTSIKRVGVVA